MKVIPSIDVETPEMLSSQINRLLPFYTHFQVDIADGKFVPFTSLELGVALSTLKNIPNIHVDFHLMANKYSSLLDELNKNSLSQQIKLVFIHSKLNPPSNMFEVGQFNFKIGIAVNPEESIDTIHQHFDINVLPAIQIMSVNPGPQGSPFLKETIQKIEQLRKVGYRNKIYLDGGINTDSIQFLLEQRFQPDYICPGSFFSRAEKIEERVQYLSEVLSHANNGDSHA